MYVYKICIWFTGESVYVVTLRRRFHENASLTSNAVVSSISGIVTAKG
jgi:hypothetical protein